MKFGLQFLLGTLLVLLSFTCNANEKDKNAAQIEKELAITARANNTETVKNTCISDWSDKSKIELNSKFSTLAEFCTCLQEEMNYLMPDALSVNLLKMQIQNVKNTPNLYLTEAEMQSTAKQWSEKYSIADRVCRAKFARRRQ